MAGNLAAGLPPCLKPGAPFLRMCHVVLASTNGKYWQWSDAGHRVQNDTAPFVRYLFWLATAVARAQRLMDKHYTRCVFVV